MLSKIILNLLVHADKREECPFYAATNILETVSLELVSLRKNRDKYRSEVTAIIRDIEEMISTMPPAKIIHT